ncbi:MAG: monofunctional biosynthetic peptidoglycan transglycosylase [Snodgrassella sp.]|jgi:monofunctional glycosyltransferase|uniref:Biosynthetic peptidoglycan transglycosylase n=1 Tax=Snodgrassella communis TaxID=2946699 RepID=A0A836MSD0_9NEIS|nr:MULTISPECIES: monofunctional biosynthetic peptidoglycan transglycosylase [Snodgrassella]KDN15919.1 Monofunctional biosynthetic peptidoglycan transglycosylase [Snodgrassella communis]MCO6505713.1 monofunctional biosynthetic peptidoglycan transglycosylase [Snodgrassella sp.]MCO6508757.1 monofunctional biosynthetic peptidoglycan transglycosylase [Snodgrassella sp.]MCO6513622.1 monofunctional biosynthetic peptidoglycan transglycosylase [Snodgrassella sp.]MCO6518085.1 monofunctional biosynthetic
MSIVRNLLIILVTIFLLFNAYVYGSLLTYRAVAPHRTMFMLLRMHELATTHPDTQLNYQWVAYNRISPNLKKALIASEDARFAEHDGFDWNGIRTAIKKNEHQGRIKAGGSTISQQLAKNLFLSESRHYWRKAEEAVITSLLEATTNKDRIFTLYLNVIEWGYGVFGAEAASETIYGRTAMQLSAQQAAKLAARVPRPLYYVDHPHDQEIRRKANVILRRMGSAQLPDNDQ